MLSTVMKIQWFSSLRVHWHLQYVISFWLQQRQRLNSHQDQITLDFMWRYACKQKTKKLGSLIYKNCIWSASESVISPVHGSVRGCCGSQADLPDGIHSICGMTFCSMGTQGHQVTVQTAGWVLRCVWPPWDTAAEWDAHHSVALQMLLTTARLSASLGLDQIHTEECCLRLSLQPPCDAARTHTDTFGFI